MAAQCLAKQSDVSSGIALYIHVPFCVKRCIYCDFVSYGAVSTAKKLRYHEALKRDIVDNSHFWPAPSGCLTAWQDKSSAFFSENLLAERRRHMPPVSSIFFGGGTPTAQPVEWLIELLQLLRRTYTLTSDCEITCEANPGTVSFESLSKLRHNGFNRLSMGVQSLDDELLTTIGRIHTAQQVYDGVQAARQAGFANLNLDVIYGLPGQSLASWQTTLNTLLQLPVQHLAAYALQVETGTVLEKGLHTGRWTLPDEEVIANMEETARHSLQKAAFEHYEISNWARSGFRCRHNMAYWRNQPYYAFGCGATAYLNGWRFRRLPNLADYCQAVERACLPVCEAERLPASEAFKESLMLALRMRRGGNLFNLCRKWQQNYSQWVNFFAELPSGLVSLKEKRLRLTGRGRDLSNEIFVRILQV